jgi:hypothetical protein
LDVISTNKRIESIIRMNCCEWIAVIISITWFKMSAPHHITSQLKSSSSFITELHNNSLTFNGRLLIFLIANIGPKTHIFQQYHGHMHKNRIKSRIIFWIREETRYNYVSWTSWLSFLWWK